LCNGGTIQGGCPNALRDSAAQQGFFTTKQAIHAGLSEETYVHHVRIGNWIRTHRGIYRLAEFPPAERPDLMLWYLWSRNRGDIPEGTYSHDTALGPHELADIMPSKLHMTAPMHFGATAESRKFSRCTAPT
jgi:predicted transcriptional regulator of viral defense system